MSITRLYCNEFGACDGIGEITLEMLEDFPDFIKYITRLDVDIVKIIKNKRALGLAQKIDKIMEMGIEALNEKVLRGWSRALKEYEISDKDMVYIFALLSSPIGSVNRTNFYTVSTNVGRKIRNKIENNKKRVADAFIEKITEFGASVKSAEDFNVRWGTRVDFLTENFYINDKKIDWVIVTDDFNVEFDWGVKVLRNEKVGRGAIIHTFGLDYTTEGHYDFSFVSNEPLLYQILPLGILDQNLSLLEISRNELLKVINGIPEGKRDFKITINSSALPDAMISLSEINTPEISIESEKILKRAWGVEIYEKFSIHSKKSFKVFDSTLFRGIINTFDPLKKNYEWNKDYLEFLKRPFYSLRMDLEQRQTYIIMLASAFKYADPREMADDLAIDYNTLVIGMNNFLGGKISDLKLDPVEQNYEDLFGNFLEEKGVGFIRDGTYPFSYKNNSEIILVTPDFLFKNGIVVEDEKDKRIKRVNWIEFKNYRLGSMDFEDQISRYIMIIGPGALMMERGYYSIYAQNLIERVMNILDGRNFKYSPNLRDELIFINGLYEIK